MNPRSKFRGFLDEDRIWFRYNSGGEYGYVDVDVKPYHVRFPDGELVGTVNSLCDALPLLAAGYEMERFRRVNDLPLPITIPMKR